MERDFLSQCSWLHQLTNNPQTAWTMEKYQHNMSVLARFILSLSTSNKIQDESFKTNNTCVANKQNKTKTYNNIFF